MVELRDYQVSTIDATFEAWGRGIRRPATVLPTGTGKTTVFSAIEGIMAERGVVSLVLAHRDELIEQAAARARLMNPRLRVGIVKGAREEIRNRNIIIGSVGTLGRAGERGDQRRAALRRAGVKLIIVDECHHAVADSYMRILRDLGCFDEVPADGSLSGAYALGVTATMTRGDGLALGQVWQEVVYRYPLLDAIRAGYLVRPRGLRVRVAGLDLGQVHKRGGDLAAGELAEALHNADAPKAIVRAWLEHAAGRPTVAFTPSVEGAYELAEAFRAEGVAAEAFDGKTPSDDRRGVLKRLHEGDLTVVVNCGVLTEGFDEPKISCVIPRPTSSSGLYVQMVGRGLRPYIGKVDCLILDPVGVTGRHKLAGLVDLAGADRNEDLPDELAIYDELPDEQAVDLLDLVDPDSEMRSDWTQAHQPPDGPLVVEVVDLLESSRSTWLRTARGVWFLEAPSEALVFLAPEPQPGRFAVCISGHHDPSGKYLHRGLDIETAMLRGEHEASAKFGTVLTRRNAGWRRQVPTSGQQSRAMRLGIELFRPDQSLKSKGEISDEIAIAKATMRLDGMLVVRTVTVDGYWPKQDDQS